MNEKFAPELLESKCEIVECVMEQLEHMVRAACLRVTKDENAKRVHRHRERQWSDSKSALFGPAWVCWFFLNFELVIYSYKA